MDLDRLIASLHETLDEPKHADLAEIGDLVDAARDQPANRVRLLAAAVLRAEGYPVILDYLRRIAAEM